MSKKGMVVVLSGPSGVGKGTINAELRKRHPELVNSISLTTRPPREGEQHGRDYFFCSRDEFMAKRDKGELLEWAEYVGHFYGTPKEFVTQHTAAGRTVILEIETQGGLQLKENLTDGVFIFVAPPQFSDLEQRIVGRGTVAPEVLARRLNRARQELRDVESYQYLVVNDRLDDAVALVEAILVAESCKVQRHGELIAELSSDISSKAN